MGQYKCCLIFFPSFSTSAAEPAVPPDSVAGTSIPAAAAAGFTLALSGATSKGSETDGETRDRTPVGILAGDSSVGDISMRLQCSANGWLNPSKLLGCANKRGRHLFSFKLWF